MQAHPNMPDTETMEHERLEALAKGGSVSLSHLQPLVTFLCLQLTKPCEPDALRSKDATNRGSWHRY